MTEAVRTTQGMVDFRLEGNDYDQRAPAASLARANGRARRNPTRAELRATAKKMGIPLSVGGKAKRKGELEEEIAQVLRRRRSRKALEERKVRYEPEPGVKSFSETDLGKRSERTTPIRKDAKRHDFGKGSTLERSRGLGVFTKPDPPRIGVNGHLCGNVIDGQAYYAVVKQDRVHSPSFVRWATLYEQLFASRRGRNLGKSYTYGTGKQPLQAGRTAEALLEGFLGHALQDDPALQALAGADEGYFDLYTEIIENLVRRGLVVSLPNGKRRVAGLFVRKHTNRPWEAVSERVKGQLRRKKIERGHFVLVVVPSYALIQQLNAQYETLHEEAEKEGAEVFAATVKLPQYVGDRPSKQRRQTETRFVPREGFDPESMAPSMLPSKRFRVAIVDKYATAPAPEIRLARKKSAITFMPDPGVDYAYIPLERDKLLYPRIKHKATNPNLKAIERFMAFGAKSFRNSPSWVNTSEYSQHASDVLTQGGLSPHLAQAYLLTGAIRFDDGGTKGSTAKPDSEVAPGEALVLWSRKARSPYFTWVRAYEGTRPGEAYPVCLTPDETNLLRTLTRLRTSLRRVWSVQQSILTLVAKLVGDEPHAAVQAKRKVDRLARALQAVDRTWEEALKAAGEGKGEKVVPILRGIKDSGLHAFLGRARSLGLLEEPVSAEKILGRVWGVAQKKKWLGSDVGLTFLFSEDVPAEHPLWPFFDFLRARPSALSDEEVFGLHGYYGHVRRALVGLFPQSGQEQQQVVQTWGKAVQDAFRRQSPEALGLTPSAHTRNAVVATVLAETYRSRTEAPRRTKKGTVFGADSVDPGLGEAILLIFLYYLLEDAFPPAEAEEELTAQIEALGGPPALGQASEEAYIVYKTYNPLLYAYTRMYWPRVEGAKQWSRRGLITQPKLVFGVDAMGVYGKALEVVQTALLSSPDEASLSARVNQLAGPELRSLRFPPSRAALARDPVAMVENLKKLAMQYAAHMPLRIGDAPGLKATGKGGTLAVPEVDPEGRGRRYDFVKPWAPPRRMRDRSDLDNLIESLGAS